MVNHGTRATEKSWSFDHFGASSCSASASKSTSLGSRLPMRRWASPQPGSVGSPVVDHKRQEPERHVEEFLRPSNCFRQGGEVLPDF